MNVPLQHHHQHTTTVSRPFFWDHPSEPVPEENFWTLWCKGRLTEADTLTIRLGATPSGLTSAHLHHPPLFFYTPDALSAANQKHYSIKWMKTTLKITGRLLSIALQSINNYVNTVLHGYPVNFVQLHQIW